MLYFTHMPYTKIKIIFLGVTVFLALVGATFFPVQDNFQSLFSGFIFMVLFPFLVVKFVFKEPIRNYGVFFPQLTKKTFLQITLLFFLALALFFLLFSYTPIGENYFPSSFPLNGFFYFIISILIGGLFSLLFSSFFQGFLLFILEKFFKEWGILLQWFCFILFLLLSGGFNWDMTPYIIISLFSGIVAYLTRSFFIGFLFTWIFVILSDMLLLKFF